jgi:hypothetical protein
MASISPICKKCKNFISALKSPTYIDFMIKKSLKSKTSKSHTWAPLSRAGSHPVGTDVLHPKNNLHLNKLCFIPHTAQKSEILAPFSPGGKLSSKNEARHFIMEQVGKCIRENSPVSLVSSHESLVMFRGTFAHLLHAWLALPAVISIPFACIGTALFLFFLARRPLECMVLMMFRDAKEYACPYGR